MHPTVISATQGTCPVCGMDLVRKAREGEEVKITEDLARLLQSPDEAVVANAKTVRGSYRKMPLQVDAQGIVTYDKRYQKSLPARIGGRLERVYLKYALQPVRQGQKVAEIYSPEMLTAQRELLFLTTNDPGNGSLINAAREKIVLLGATPGEVEDLIKRGETNPRFAIHSPYSGYVIIPEPEAPSTGAAISPGTPAGTSDMGGGTTSPASQMQKGQAASLIREGDYVSRGQTLFSIVSNDAMIVEISLPAQQANPIKSGNLVKLQTQSGPSFSAKVDFLQPYFSEAEEFVKIRVYVRKAGLQISELVEATLITESPETLWLPSTAVYDLGTRQVVFVKERGMFKARPVTSGLRSGDWIEILSGLVSSDEVAAQAAYLVDSESFIKTGSPK